MLLLIEAFEENRDGKRTTGFRHAFARFHYWNVSVYEEDRKVWDAPTDTSHEQNALGDKKNLEKTYNSDQPRDGAEK